MSSELDKYLKKGGFSDKEKQALQVQEARNVDRNSAPTLVNNQPQQSRPEAPQPKPTQEQVQHQEEVRRNAPDAYDQTSAKSGGMDKASDQAKSVNKDWLKEYDNTKEKNQPLQQDQERPQDIDRWEDDGGR